jgi:catechol 2,3-dioxygenase-like lactoylglutathione lyase family enzyme
MDQEGCSGAEIDPGCSMTYHLHHIHLICRDLETMIGFFTDSIGASLVERRKFGTADGATLDLKGIHINLRVVREDEEINSNIAQSTYGYDHIGLEVKDIQAAYQALTSRGYKFFLPPREVAGLTIAFFKGPENITIELVQS